MLIYSHPVLHVYPGIFCAAALSSSIPSMAKAYQLWTQHVRDKEFLLEMRLQNRDQEAEAAKARRLDKGKGKAEPTASPLPA
jgi:E3 ubiquitin-protein ligase MARCH6